MAKTLSYCVKTTPKRCVPPPPPFSMAKTFSDPPFHTGNTSCATPSRFVDTPPPLPVISDQALITRSRHPGGKGVEKGGWGGGGLGRGGAQVKGVNLIHFLYKMLRNRSMQLETLFRSHLKRALLKNEPGRVRCTCMYSKQNISARTLIIL